MGRNGYGGSRGTKGASARLRGSWGKWFVCLLAVPLWPASGAIYYVSADGDDAASGRSKKAAWRTVERVNAADFKAGDSILFEGGMIFEGSLRFDEKDSGRSGKPVKVGAFGSERAGRPVLRAGDGRGIDLYNVSWFQVADLVIEGSGPKTNTEDGILLLSSRDEGGRNITIENVEISGFGDAGVSIGVWETERGFENVRITRSAFHDNRKAGVHTWGKWGRGIYSHRKILIADSIAYNMKGGSGLILSSVDGGVIERCVAHTNGEEVSGAAGIWAWDSNDILFQYNESYGNRTTRVDGDGFDFDGGVTNSVMQYNYSHDNDAAGFLLAQYAFAPQAMENIVIRYNISENDCRKRDYGAIHIWKGREEDEIRNVQIYQNTVYLSGGDVREPEMPEHEEQEVAAATGWVRGGSAIAIISTTESVSIKNNLFYTTGGRALVSVVPGQENLFFCSNAYWSGGDPFLVQWKGGLYASLGEWLEAAPLQERIDSKILAIHADPMLVAPGAGGTVGSPELLRGMNAYRLQPNSPLQGRGVDLAGSFGIDPGAQGFYGDPITKESPPSIGANISVESF
jgi:hypothetical protein